MRGRGAASSMRVSRKKMQKRDRALAKRILG